MNSNITEGWSEFYMWLETHGYEVVKEHHIFRGTKYITDFDPQEDHDSGEIQQTIERIKAIDSMYLSNIKEQAKPLMMTSPKEVEFAEKASESADIILRQIRNQKMEIVKARLNALKKLNLLKDLDKKRFKPIMTEKFNDGTEKIWINDGTYKGKLLVTFLPLTEAEINDKDFKGKLLYI